MEKKQEKKYIKIITISILIIFFVVSIGFSSTISSGIKRALYKAGIRTDNDDLVVHFIDVGQGDAIAISFPSGESMLIDAGPKQGQNNLVEYVKDKVLSSSNYLNIDYLVLTHPDTDHSGGMSAIFDEFEINNFYRPNIASASEDKNDYIMQFDAIEYDETIARSKAEKGLNITTVVENIQFNVGDVEITIFSPLKKYNTTNSMSLVIKITYLDKSFLFCGDIQSDAERDLMTQYGQLLDCDVLKVAHHGSGNSTSEDFVNLVTPQYSIISVGSNSYGHPRAEIIERLQQANSIVEITDEGSIMIVCGINKFGLLKNVHHSFEFVEWWIIASIITVGLIVWLTINVITIMKDRKESKIN